MIPTGDGPEFDAVVVGSGPNGLVAALTLADEGWRVLVLEAADAPGGGLRSGELLEPGIVHDICSAIHPLGLASPALRSLPLADHGLEWVHPGLPLAHPLADGRAAFLHRSVAETAGGLGADRQAYHRLYDPLVRAGLDLSDSVLASHSLPPAHPFALARFAPVGIRSAWSLARARFGTDEGRALLAGLSAHATLPLRAPVTGGYGLLLGLLGHLVGWPMAQGGSGRIADALVALLAERGGTVICDHRVTNIDDLPPARTVLLDLTPRQVLAVAGHRLPDRYRRRLARWRYGAGVFKVDWVLDGPVPWTNPDVGLAGTVHLGGTLEEITAAESEVALGVHPERPYVLLAQQSRFDPSRTVPGREALWAYCHVPNGSTVDMTEAIERQIERFAPDFRDRVVARRVAGPRDMERHDANYVGGDIGGGVADLRQLVARPTLALHPWATPLPGLFLCSSSTPPGSGVHGMCGRHAALEVLRRT